MTNDFNYVMFNQHLFGDQNEFELAKRDQWFNCPGRDLLIQDYSQIVGLDHKNTFSLVCLCQYLFIFPCFSLFEQFVFGNNERWTTFYRYGWEELFVYCDWRIVVFLIGYSIIVVIRPVIIHIGVKSYTLEQ